jgi:orotate phosphoribosyltransferase
MRFSVTSGTGTAEVVDHLESAKAALHRALALIARKRKNVRVFDENGRFQSLAHMRRLVTQEAAKPAR